MLQRLKDVWMRQTDPARAETWPYVAPVSVRKMVLLDPIPLLLPDAKLMVLFSAKSACTSVVIWFLNHLGHAKAARDYANWPHFYRNEVYYKSKAFRHAWGTPLREYRLVKVMRDPFQRAASSFRHLVRHIEMDPSVGAFLQRDDLEEKGLSFDEFLRFLEASDVSAVNPHYKLQRHPIEDRLRVRHLINVSQEDLFARLNEVERDVGLPVTDFSALAWIHEAQDGRGVPYFESDEDISGRRFMRNEAYHGPWPSPGTLLTAEARSRIARIYAADVQGLTQPAGRGAR